MIQIPTIPGPYWVRLARKEEPILCEVDSGLYVWLSGDRGAHGPTMFEHSFPDAIFSELQTAPPIKDGKFQIVSHVIYCDPDTKEVA